MGCNTSSLLETLEGAFGSIDQENISIASISEVKEAAKEDIPSSPSTPSPAESGPVGAELVFPYTGYSSCDSWDSRIPSTSPWA